MEPRRLEDDPAGGGRDLGVGAPITPPMAVARVSSAMTSVSASAYDRPSSVVSVSAARAPHDNGRPGQARVIERVHRVAQLEQHVVGDVDDVADRPDAAGGQPARHPRRRGCDRDIGDTPT